MNVNVRRAGAGGQGVCGEKAHTLAECPDHWSQVVPDFLDRISATR